MPDGEIIGTPENPVLFSGRSSAAAGYTVSGSAKSWRDNVARLAFGNYSMMTGIGAALAAPLIGLVGADGFGIHFYEQSSAGKTTTANVASSLYGNPDLLRLTWYGTALGLANEAAAHNDGLMPLDEVGQGADPVSVSQSAYALFNGVGKLQGAKDGGNRDLKRWRTVAISTGEMDLETFIATSGRKTKAGQLVRLLNIPLSKAVRFHDYQNGKQHADALKDAYQHHHGASGREWIKWLADHQQQAIKTVRDCESRWRSLIPRFTSFCLIACFIDPFSYHTPIIKSLLDGIGNDLYNCRFVIWFWWDVRLSGNKRRSGFFHALHQPKHS